MLSGRKFAGGCAAVAALLVLLSRSTPLPLGLLAAEVFVTIVGLFAFGSFTYQIHKNALTYGMLLVVAATFSGLKTSVWHEEIAQRGWGWWIAHHLVSFHGLDELIHADTMLFILGLTLFVAVVAQTRLLEGITFAMLRRHKGAILPTVVGVTAVVAVASGVLDGVSMIGLTIRTLVIILMLAAVRKEVILEAVMICTTVTTICGIWLAYGEPPNLIMKANLTPHLEGAFFLRYCAAPAVATYFIVVRHLRKRMANLSVDLEAMDVLDANAEDVRFLQASRHGEVLTPIEVIESHIPSLEAHTEGVLGHLRRGSSLGAALVRAEVPAEIRKEVLGHYVSAEFADSLDRHYVLDVAGDYDGAMLAEQWVDDALAASAHARRRAQLFGALALIPFVVLLIIHGIDRRVPLFLSSFAGFAFALIGIVRIPRMRALAVREAKAEYAEYYFLFPLFLSITLLTAAGFFSSMDAAIHHANALMGQGHVALLQFAGATVLSAVLDNNVVADFGSRALAHLDVSTLHLFAMSQIAGYALGGCWTHIGCAQSVVAYSFIQREVDAGYTPIQWIRAMTPIILEMAVVITALLYLESAILR